MWIPDRRAFQPDEDSKCKGPGVESCQCVKEYQEGCVMKWIEWDGGM